MVAWLLKRRLAQAKPTLVFFVGGRGKSMAMAAALSVLRALRSDVQAISSVRDIARALLAPDSNGGLLATLKQILWGKAYPGVVCLEVQDQAVWPGEEVLSEASRIIFVIPSLHVHRVQDVAAYVRRLLKPFGKQREALTIIYNADAEGLREVLADQEGERVSFAIDHEADFHAGNIEPTIQGQDAGETSDGRWRGVSCKVQISGSTVPMQLFGGLGRAHILAGLSALAIGQRLDVNMVEAIQALRSHTPLPGRMSLVAGIKKSLLIDDTYDTDPVSLALVLQEVAAWPLLQGKKRIAVLGEMPNAGPQSAAIHCGLGELVSGLPFDLVVGVGEQAAEMLACAARVGMDKNRLVHFNDKIEAGKFVQHALRQGELVLVKGAAKDKLESVVKELMAFPLKAKQELLER
ncbi:MAG: hypothetical protein HY461_00010 [Parcubacteria group bacterium]|nr:hypothetical protein [Parcubacteria group bacterium]